MKRRDALRSLFALPFVAKAVLESKIAEPIIEKVPEEIFAVAVDAYEEYHELLEGVPYFNPMGIMRYHLPVSGEICADYMVFSKPANKKEPVWLNNIATLYEQKESNT